MKRMIKRKEKHFLATVFLTSGLLLITLSLSTKITGNTIISSTFINQNISFPTIGLLFLLTSFLFMTSRKESLEAIIIPTGESRNIDQQRARAGATVYQQKPGSKIIISGIFNKPKGTFLGSQTSAIYKTLRKKGVPREDIEIEGQSQDSMQNVLYVSDILKNENINNITLITDRDHARRMSMLFRKARETGIAPRDLEIHSHSYGIEKAYGPLKAQIAYTKDFALPLKGGKDKPKGIKRIAKRILTRE